MRMTQISLQSIGSQQPNTSSWGQQRLLLAWMSRLIRVVAEDIFHINSFCRFCCPPPDLSTRPISYSNWLSWQEQVRKIVSPYGAGFFLLCWSILVASWPNKMACAPSEDSDQPGHPPSLIRIFAVRMKKAWVLGYPLSTQHRLWSDWADAQADLSLRWAHMPFFWFFHEAAHFKRVHRCCKLICSEYCKTPKNSDTRNNCCNYPKILPMTTCINFKHTLYSNQQNLPPLKMQIQIAVTIVFRTPVPEHGSFFNMKICKTLGNLTAIS